MAITQTSLVNLALLGVRDRALTLDQIARAAEPLSDYLERRGISVRCDRETLRAGVDRLVETGAATVFTGGTEPVWAIAHGAAFHRDDSLHHFVTRAVVELSLPRAAQAHGDPADAIADEALRLCDLLQVEFSRDELTTELRLLDPGWRMHMRSPLEALSLLADSGMLVAHRCLEPFVEAQYAVAARLVARDPRVPLDDARLLEECEGVGHQFVLQGRLHRVEPELVASALELAKERGLLAGGEGPRAWLDEVDDVLGRLQLISDLDATAFEDVLDGVAS